MFSKKKCNMQLCLFWPYNSHSCLIGNKLNKQTWVTCLLQCLWSAERCVWGEGDISRGPAGGREGLEEAAWGGLGSCPDCSQERQRGRRHICGPFPVHGWTKPILKPFLAEIVIEVIIIIINLSRYSHIVILCYAHGQRHTWYSLCMCVLAAGQAVEQTPFDTIDKFYLFFSPRSFIRIRKNWRLWDQRCNHYKPNVNRPNPSATHLSKWEERRKYSKRRCSTKIPSWSLEIGRHFQWIQ